MDVQDNSQWTATLNTLNSSLNSIDRKHDKASLEKERIDSSISRFGSSSDSSDTIFSGLEMKVSKIRELKQRLFAISKRLKESSREKAELMKRIGNMEIQLIHLKELKVEEDFKKISEYQKDFSERSKINLMHIISDTKELMEREKLMERNEKGEGECQNAYTTLVDTEGNPRRRMKKEPTPEPQTIPLDPEAKQKWLRRMLAGKTAASKPSISESTRIVYSKKPNVPVFAVDSQHSQLTKNQCSSLPSESDCDSCSESFEQQNTNSNAQHSDKS